MPEWMAPETDLGNGGPVVGPTIESNIANFGADGARAGATAQLRNLVADLRRLTLIANYTPDFSGLRNQAERIARDSNAQHRLQGLGNDGGVLIEAKESTIRRRGPGVVMAPKGYGSRAIKDFRATASVPRRGELGMATRQNFFFFYHSTGYPNHGTWVPERDILGLTIEAQEQIAQLMLDEAASQVLERWDWKAPGDYLRGMGISSTVIPPNPFRR